MSEPWPEYVNTSPTPEDGPQPDQEPRFVEVEVDTTDAVSAEL